MNGAAAPGRTAPALDGFRARWDVFRDHIDARLATLFAERRRAWAGDAIPLIEAVESLVLAGGKRLRPALVYFVYAGCGGEDEDAVFPLAMSTELLHAYLLIHDDIMDHAELRRGQPAAHARFADRHRHRGWSGDATDYGSSIAILAGDLAFSWAVELFDRACRSAPPTRPADGASSPDRAGLESAFAAMCQEVIVGQFLELHLPYAPETGEEELLRILRLKSGRYSVERPVELGARLAGAPEPLREALGEYGRAVGEAFQLQDDLLGLFGDEDAVGKPVGSDVAEGKRTLVVHHALRRASPERAARLRALLGRPDLDRRGIEEARSLIRESGGLEAVRTMIEERLEGATRTLQALDRLSLGPDARSFLAGLIAYSRERDR